MTENEKLRALLAEARAAIHQVIDIDALQGWACESRSDELSTETLLRHLRQRIDEALAEPVGECELCAVSKAFHDVAVSQRDGNAYLLAEVERERDEARAEVKELREVLKTAGDRLKACDDDAAASASLHRVAPLTD